MSSHRGDARIRVCRDPFAVEAFWTIASYVVVFGIPVLVGYLFYYWFIVRSRDDGESKTE